MLQPWWERFPEVLRDEEADLERLGGRPPVLNRQLLEGGGIRQYEVSYTHGGETCVLTVTYSDLHPYFRVEVATAHEFRTHRQPFAGNLCLIRGGTWNWNVDETAAQLIESQMPLLIADNLGPDESDDDTGAGPPGDPPRSTHVEPFVSYYSYAPEAVVRVDGDWADLTEAERGSLVIGIDQPPNLNALRGAVLEVRDDNGGVLRRAHPHIAEGYPTRVAGRWCRLDTRPERDDPQCVLDEASQKLPGQVAASSRVGEFDLEVTGAVFTDGVRPDGDGDAWTFVVRAVGQRPPQKPTSKGGRGGRVAPERPRVGPYLARAARAGVRDMTERVPSLAPLRTKKVVLFGAGGVGAPSAIEFAKAGIGTLVIVESDLIEPGNAPRWVAGYQVAGLHKLAAMNQLLRWNWPYTRLELIGWRLGTARADPAQRPDWDALNELLRDADLIYDATAEVGVNYFLAEVAKEFGVPSVVASATEGGWGGRIARFRPGANTACWTCLMHHVEDDPTFMPAADPDPATREVWPAGCTDPTFTGAGFDILTISAAGVRLAISTLCEQSPGAYPPAPWDVATYQFRDAESTLATNATTRVLPQHPSCKPCRIRWSG